MSGEKVYQQGKNWTSEGGQYRNGHGQPISAPSAYFNAVSGNNHGYNTGYANGVGQPINNPSSYFKSVAEDRYGYNGSSNNNAKK